MNTLDSLHFTAQSIYYYASQTQMYNFINLLLRLIVLTVHLHNSFGTLSQQLITSSLVDFYVELLGYYDSELRVWVSSDEIKKIPAIAKNFIFINFIVVHSNSRWVLFIGQCYRILWATEIFFQNFVITYFFICKICELMTCNFYIGNSAENFIDRSVGQNQEKSIWGDSGEDGEPGKVLFSPGEASVRSKSGKMVFEALQIFFTTFCPFKQRKSYMERLKRIH